MWGLWHLAHCGALFACVREPAHHSALRCHSSVYFSSNQVGIFITKKRKKREGNKLYAPPPRISGFRVVANMATCNFIKILCNFLSLKITNPLLKQLYLCRSIWKRAGPNFARCFFHWSLPKIPRLNKSRLASMRTPSTNNWTRPPCASQPDCASSARN